MTDSEHYRIYAERIRIFNGLGPDDVRDVLSHGRVFQFEASQNIFSEGTLGSSIFIVLEGVVDIYSKNKFIGRCVSGDAFGEMAVLNHRPRTVSATAHTCARVFTLAESELNQIFEKKMAVRILLNVIHVLSERLEDANLHIAERQLVRTD